MEIKKLDQTNAFLIPQVLGLYKIELAKLIPLYPAGYIESKLGEMDEIYFRRIAQGEVFPNGRRRELDLLVENNNLEGVLEHSQHFDHELLIGDILWVLDKTKGKGYGTQLIKNYIATSDEEGCDIVGLTVSRKNQDAIRLYKRLGFTYTVDLGNTGLQVYGLGISDRGKKVFENK